MRQDVTDALLDDEDTDAAWQAATRNGAHDRQGLALADQSRATRPADALDVYLRLAEPLTKQTGNAVYDRLVTLLLKSATATAAWAPRTCSPHTSPPCAPPRDKNGT